MSVEAIRPPGTGGGLPRISGPSSTPPSDASRPDRFRGGRDLGRESSGWPVWRDKPDDGIPESGTGLSGADRDAYVALTHTLKEYGLESLADDVLKFIREGYSPDTINILLQETDAYRKRFAANEARRQKGLPVLSPSEYLATERAYRQVMSAAGLPVGFYDEPSDFERWLSDDVSPVEVQERVRIATDLVTNIDPATRSQFEEWYTPGEMVAYALDRDRAVAVLDKQVRAAGIGGAARNQGMSIDSGLGERLAMAGVDPNQARQGFGTVRTIADNAQRLSAVYGGEYDEDDAVSEVFFADSGAATRRRRLASQERAAFSGSSNVNSGSLARQSAGQF